MAASSKFRSKIWDPSLIIFQIISMQFQFYSTLLILNYMFSRFVHFAYNRNFNGADTSNQVVYSLEQIFDHRLINFHNASNTFICFSFIINSLIRYISSQLIFIYINKNNQQLFLSLIQVRCSNGSLSIGLSSVWTLQSLCLRITYSSAGYTLAHSQVRLLTGFLLFYA